MQRLLIETDRITIAAFDEGMIASVHKNSLDEDNRRFVPDEVFETLEEASAIVQQIRRWYTQERAPLVYAILLKNGAHIGHVQAVPAGEVEWEIGYHIAKQYAGNGYATEAVKAFLPVMIERLGVERIQGRCLTENTASSRVLEKSGFTLVYCGPGDYQGEIRDVSRYLYFVA